MKTLTLLSFLLTVSVSLSKANHHHGGDGFTVDLIHRDSPLSPFYNPTYSRWDRIQNAFLRSVSQASHLPRRAGFTLKIDADIFQVSGDYLMHLQIGNPPVEVLGVFPAVLDLSWVQCQPCTNCYKQISPPVFKPNDSSTYRTLSCQSKACKALDGSRLSCDSKNVCRYNEIGTYDYSVSGDLATDTFWFGPNRLKNVVFGCGHDNNGTFNNKSSGIIGLGPGPLSLISQLYDTIQGKFSYCLLPTLYDNLNVTSKFHFGERAEFSGPDVVSTPLEDRFPPIYYYVTLYNVLVGNRSLSYMKTGMKNHFERGNVIMDSSELFTYLPDDYLDDLKAALTQAIGGETAVDPQGGLCYKDLNLDGVPTITFQFVEADVEVPRENVFLEVRKGVSCLTIVPSNALGSFGNLFQRNLLVGYDLVNKKVSFKHTDCRKHVFG